MAARFVPYVTLWVLLLNAAVITTQNYPYNLNPAPVYPDADYAESVQYSDYSGPGDKSWNVAQRPQYNAEAALARLNYSLTYAPSWPARPIAGIGQVSAVALDRRGRVVVFHRATHVWDRETFTSDNRYTGQDRGPIAPPTVVVLNSTTGLVVEEWGQNMFYLPHGLTVDSQDNIWVTDVALHQVMKFEAGNRKHPSLVLGKKFVPGKDDSRFCKPSGVAVMESGDFFVSDGYCNTRVIKYSPAGVKILEWGRNTFTGIAQVIPLPYSFAIPHALALAEDKRLICVADRENGRVQCFDCHNGTFVSQFHSPLIGSRLFSAAYSPAGGGRLYVVNGPEYGHKPVRGFIIDVDSKRIMSQFAPDDKDFSNPHDIAVSRDGREVYVVELDPYKVHKFVDTEAIEVVKKADAGKISEAPSEKVTANKSSSGTTPTSAKPTATVEGLSLVGSGWGGWAGVAGGVAGGLGAVMLLLLGGAALLLRARHRGGCLSPLTPRNRRQRWDYAPGAPDFKFRHLLERPRGSGFERVNTEESDEEPTPATSMLTPQNA